jgi:hypothetical protein
MIFFSFLLFTFFYRWPNYEQARQILEEANLLEQPKPEKPPTFLCIYSGNNNDGSSFKLPFLIAKLRSNVFAPFDDRGEEGPKALEWLEAVEKSNEGVKYRETYQADIISATTVIQSVSLEWIPEAQAWLLCKEAIERIYDKVISVDVSDINMLTHFFSVAKNAIYGFRQMRLRFCRLVSQQ